MNEEESKPEVKQQEIEKKETPEESRKKTIHFIIFAGILIILFLAIVFVPKFIKDTKFNNNKYNNFEFIEGKDGFWYTVVQKGPQPYQIPFYYHPRDLEDIGIETGLRDKFFEIADNNGSIFITLDPDSEDNRIVIAGVEISRITGGRYDLLNVPTGSGFIKQPKNIATETQTPIITCKHASNQTMVIWITLSNVNVAYSEGYCVILEAKTYEDMIRIADRTMYHLLGIMN